MRSFAPKITCKFACFKDDDDQCDDIGPARLPQVDPFGRTGILPGYTVDDPSDAKDKGKRAAPGSLARRGTLENDLPPAYTCEHKPLTSCLLSAPYCCSCLDRRPEVESYPVYKDGRGWVDAGSRWEHYCYNCKTALQSGESSSKGARRVVQDGKKGKS